MKTVTAIVGWHVEVSIEVDDNLSNEDIKEKLCDIASLELIKGQNIAGPDIEEASEDDLIDA